jgi:ribosome recycling factor
MLTTENRTKLTKILKEKLEDARITVRKERQNQIDTLLEMSEDEVKRAKEEIQKCVDEANKNLEAIFTKKETEVMS